MKEGRLKERVALKIGYIGTNYHGFQIQPRSGLPTIEGELFKALKKQDIIEDRKTANYSAAGRTDKGVHALAQVVSFVTSNQNTTPRMINSVLPDGSIWVSAIAKPYSGFNARKDAISREYRYCLFLQTELDLDLDLYITRMREASELFVGTHDFSNFSLLQGHEYEVAGYSTTRVIKRIAVKTKKPFVIIDIEASGFLRKMVRKIVSALRMVGSGMKDERWIEDLLDLRIKDGIEPAPAFGLVLKNVSYRDVKFVEDEYAKRRIVERLKRDLVFHATMAEVLGDMEIL
ncbi:MAG: tRNA pseudouridine(38-40) synthase TruA [Halobacteriota archaeon]